MLISSFRQLVSPCRLYNKFSHWKNIYIYMYPKLILVCIPACCWSYNFIQPLRAENGRSANMHASPPLNYVFQIFS